MWNRNREIRTFFPSCMGTLKLVLIYIMYKTDDLTEEEISCKNPHGDKEYSSNSHSCDNLNEGGFGFLGFAVLAAKKKFGFSVVVFFVVCGFSVFQRLVFAFRQKHYRDFGLGMRCGFLFFLSGFRFLFDLSSNFVPPLISNSCETSVCSICHQC